MTIPSSKSSTQSSIPAQSGPLHEYIRDLHQPPAYHAEAVAQYQFPPAMSAKLQAEQKWTLEYTQRVLQEYRRFIHLAATAGHEVTPSQIVDEAWHMHLTFSRDYWEKLAPLLPAPLHHEPASGEPGDTQNYAEQYRRTLDDYRATFGQEPPADIWRTSQPRRRRRRQQVAGVLGALFGSGMMMFLGLSLIPILVAGVVGYLLFSTVAGAQWTGSGGSCGGGACGFVGGDSCDGSDGGGDGGGDGGSCGGGCGGGCSN